MLFTSIDYVLLLLNPCLLAKYQYLHIINGISASKIVFLYSLQLNLTNIGHKLTFGIFSINLAVFLLWRIPAARPFMTKYFASNPAVKKNCLPMLLCAFSHMGPLHFGFNMFALSSFAPPLVDIMGKEHFLGAYLTGAVVSSFTSYFYRVSNIFYVSLQYILCITIFKSHRSPKNEMTKANKFLFWVYLICYDLLKKINRKKLLIALSSCY